MDYEDNSVITNIVKYSKIGYFKRLLESIKAKKKPKKFDETVRLLNDSMDLVDMREVLKKNRKFSEYVNIPYYYKFVHKLEIEYLTHTEEKMILDTFKIVLSKYKDMYADKRYFIGYWFLMYKIIEHLGYDRFLNIIPIISSRKTYNKNMSIWSSLRIQ